MAHVQIRIGQADGDDRLASVVVDGVDLTKAVLAEGFAVEFNNPIQGKSLVTMTLRVDRLDMDLPDSVLNATQMEV